MAYSRRRSRRTLPTATLFLGMIVLVTTLFVPRRATTDDVSIETVQFIDLSASSAEIQLLGAGDNDRLPGNGSVNNFATFPRTRALAKGDINDDGIDDLILGAPDLDFTPQGGDLRQDAGAVFVLFGRPSFAGLTVVDTNPAAIMQPDIKIYGAIASDNLGFALASGDVNGDGFDDIVIGAPGFDLAGPTPRDNTGAVYVVFGAAGFPPKIIDLATADSANVQIIGEQADDRFGSALAIGEVNGGASAVDLLVGAPASQGPDPAGSPRDDGGAAFLLFGGSGLSNPLATTRVIDLNDSPAPVRVFGKAGSQLGSSLAIGDVNDSGAGDLLIGAPRANTPNPGGDVAETGAAFGVFGGANLNPAPPATAKTFDINSTQQNLSIYGSVGGDHLGASIAAGDVTGEGATDLVIGAPQSGGPGNLKPSCGQAYVIAGGPGLNPVGGATELRIDLSLTTAALTVVGATTGNALGSALAVGVVNTQGNTDVIADILLGAPGALSNRGSVHVLFGGPNLLVFPGRDIALNQDDLRISGQADDDEFGWAITTGDFDDNTGGDIAAGAPFNDVQVALGATRTDAGRAYVLLADPEHVPPQNQNPSVELVSPNGGETVSGGADFEISWTATDLDGNNTIQDFTIRLSTDGGAAFNTIVAQNIPGDERSLVWNVPIGLNTAAARLRIEAFDNAGGTDQDDSDENFTITDAGVLLAVVTPNGGEIIRQNQIFKITWAVGLGFENQVKGFDLFYSTDNGETFTSITPINPIDPALAGDVDEFDWPVPAICSSTVKVFVRATSLTNAVSSDSSNGNFTIAEVAPQIDPSSMTFNGSTTKLNFRIVEGSQPRFLKGVKVEISTDQAGSQFFQTQKAKVKGSGRKLQTRGDVNGQSVGEFFPDGARRIIRITNPICGIVVLAVRRMGSSLVIDTALRDDSSVWQ